LAKYISINAIWQCKLAAEINKDFKAHLNWTRLNSHLQSALEVRRPHEAALPILPNLAPDPRHHRTPVHRWLDRFGFGL
jgi:hypothetical protein